MSKAVKDSTVIHYHRDTKDIDSSLTKGSVYKTSKGTGRYKGLSQSNGKVLFVNVENGKNIYFTRAEWIEGGDSPKNIDTQYMEKIATKNTNQVKTAVRGLNPNRSILKDTMDDNFSNTEALYLGITPNGIGVKYNDGGKTVVYYNQYEFGRRFEVVDVGTPEPVVNKVLDKPKKKLKKKR